jgi:hypothetical protein
MDKYNIIHLRVFSYSSDANLSDYSFKEISSTSYGISEKGVNCRVIYALFMFVHATFNL